MKFFNLRTRQTIFVLIFLLSLILGCLSRSGVFADEETSTAVSEDVQEDTDNSENQEADTTEDEKPTYVSLEASAQLTSDDSVEGLEGLPFVVSSLEDYGESLSMPANLTALSNVDGKVMFGDIAIHSFENQPFKFLLEPDETAIEEISTKSVTAEVSLIDGKVQVSYFDEMGNNLDSAVFSVSTPNQQPLAEESFQCEYLDETGTRVETGTFDSMFPKAVESGGSLKLWEDLNISSSVSADGAIYNNPSSNVITIDLNGHDINYTGSEPEGSEDITLFSAWRDSGSVGDGGFHLTDSSGELSITKVRRSDTSSVISYYDESTEVFEFSNPGDEFITRVNIKDSPVGKINLNNKTRIKAFVFSNASFLMDEGIFLGAGADCNYLTGSNNNSCTISGGVFINGDYSIVQSGSPTTLIENTYFIDVLGAVHTSGSVTINNSAISKCETGIYASSSINAHNLHLYRTLWGSALIGKKGNISLTGNSSISDCTLGSSPCLNAQAIDIEGTFSLLNNTSNGYLINSTSLSISGDAKISNNNLTGNPSDVKLVKVSESCNLSGNTVITNNILKGSNSHVVSAKDLSLSENVLITNNSCSSSDSGLMNATGTAALLGNVKITGNSAKVGSALYTKNLVLGDNVQIKNNKASDSAAVYTSGSVKILGSPEISGNTAGFVGGGLYITGKDLTMEGSPIFENNISSGSISAGLFLSEGSVFKLSGELINPRIQVISGSTKEIIPVIEGGSGLDDSFASKITSAVGSLHSVITPDGGLNLERTNLTYVPIQIFGNKKLLDAGSVPIQEDSAGKRVSLTDASITLNSFQNGIFTSNIKNQFAIKDKDDNILVLDSSVIDANAVTLPTEFNSKEDSLLFLSKSIAAGTYTLDELKEEYGYWKVEVRDIYSLYQKLDSSESIVKWVVDGGSFSTQLTQRNAPFKWHILESEEDNFNSEVTEGESSVSYSLSEIHSPVLITNGNSLAVTYTVQTYGYVDTLALTDTEGEYNLPVIATGDRSLPKNSATQPVKFLQIDKDDNNRVINKSELTQLYKDQTYLYAMNPRLAQIEQLGETNGYELSEIWILKEGRSSTSINPDDFIRYKESDFPELESLRELHLTNNKDSVDRDTVLIENGTVLRFVYSELTSIQTKPTDFYDYDITDGFLYSDAGRIQKHNTSEQNTSSPWYVKTNQQGINSRSNYETGKSKFGFGNANTGTELQTQVFPGTGLFLNQGNRGRVDGNPEIYMGCIFGLVDGLGKTDEGNFYPIFANGVSAPDLYAQGKSTKGKTEYKNLDMHYKKTGDTYVLTGFEDNLTDLDCFKHPQEKYKNIWTNEFWAMDYVDSFGADTHDPKWGEDKAVNPHNDIRYGDNSWNTLPPADANVDHNSYFGMTFSLNFTVPKGYVGPMEYCFFGDDDLWIFLDGEQIVDIGGVHSSVGQYVNLWDYLEESDKDTDHEMVFFYTERGASGSTCWMQFTMPRLRFGSTSQEVEDGSISISKEADGGGAIDGRVYEFDITIKDKDGNLTGDDFSYRRLDKDGNMIDYGLLEKGNGTLGIEAGETLTILGIPPGFHYEVSEHKYACDTEITVNGENTEPGRVIRGVIEGNVDCSLHFQNHFSSGLRLPDTGSVELIELIITGLYLIAIGYHIFKATRRA